ncbi:hypothetical protein [Trichodesmium erythraeum]|nr:hypothetical protein [Trichodesmium sp. St11_bin5]MDT9339356.1 hypothetical protein [Trichodesmium erythraeum 21-75]
METIAIFFRAIATNWILSPKESPKDPVYYYFQLGCHPMNYKT